MGAIIAIIMLLGARCSRWDRSHSSSPAATGFRDTGFAPADDGSRDERAVARAACAEIRSGHVEMVEVTFRYPGAVARQPRRTSISNLAPASGSASSAGSPRASRRWAACCAGSIAPTGGEMLIDGFDSRQYHPHQLREAFRFVGQDAEVFSGTVREI